MLRMMFNVMHYLPKSLSFNGLALCVWFSVCVQRGAGTETGVGNGLI